ncbi:MAG TPA: adenylate/guanylate cyclase domain-containing protein [Rhodocyclaceae bacterium]|nr:adenylate/guanylate cyclase domain-containing protein [Rhodocyclaceae bacterium]
MKLSYFVGRKSAWIALMAALLATFVAEGLYRTGLATRIEHIYSDAWHRFAGKRATPSHAALVMLDDPSLNERPDEPLAFWTPHFAHAVETLRAVGVKTIAIDFIFSGSPERWIEKMGLMGSEASRTYDRHFREEINRGGVLLAGYKVGAGETVDDFVLPSPDYLIALPNLDMTNHVGLANLRADPDSAVRRFVLVDAASDYAKKEGMPQMALGALAAARATAQTVPRDSWTFGGRSIPAVQEIPISYAGPPGAFRAVSFRKLLAKDAQLDPEVRALAGKTVIIGSGYAGMNDVHPTPYSTSLGGANALMPGPEIQTNIIETLLSGRFIDEAPAVVRLLTFVSVFGALAFIGRALSAVRSVLLFLMTALLSAWGAYVAFKYDLLFPVAHLQLGMLVVLVCLALMRLTHEERERGRIGQMFGRYVSPQVMTALLASPELPELGGQARQITVLFSDIRNFTTLSEKLSAREVVELLNTYFERACAVLLAEGAIIDKFIGDAIMCEFGAPLAQPDHARRALRAAVALRQVSVEFRSWVEQRFAGRGLPEFDIGIGLHSGEAVVGNIGSSARMEYTAIGDTVNVASRLEGMTKSVACPILASRDTVAASGGNIRTGALHSLAVKGRHQEVEAYEILGVDPS